MSDVEAFKYWAFISYSHQDQRWAAWLVRCLERYRLPPALVGRVSRDGPLPRRLFPVFRDRDELASAPELGVEIERALRASRYLVVICSPASAQSRWVNEEIRYFKSLGREDRVLCCIVDGEPAADPPRDCFAPALRRRIGGDGRLSDEAAEPIAADARPQGDGRDKAALKLIAGILGLGYDELRRRDLIARNRRLAFISAGSLAVASLTVVLAITALFARQTAERHRQQAEHLIGFMLGDLRGKLEPVGRLDVLDAVGEQAMRYFAEVERDGGSDAALAARAKALRQIGEIRTAQGRLVDAAQSFAAALELDRDLARGNPQDTQAIFNLGQSEFWAGYAAWLADDFVRAERHFLAYRQAADRLLQIDPQKPEWLQELGYGESNLGIVADSRQQPQAALAHFRLAQEVAADLRRRFPDELKYQSSYAAALSWTASALEKLGQTREAAAHLQEQRQVLFAQAQRFPQDMSLQYQLVQPLLLLTDLQAKTGDWHELDTRHAEALQRSATLVARDPANLDWRDALLRAHAAMAIGHELRGDFHLAQQQAEQALQHAAQCHRTEPQQARWRRLYLQSATRVASLQLQRGEPRRAEQTLVDASAALTAMPTRSADDLDAVIEQRLLRRELGLDAASTDAALAAQIAQLRRVQAEAADAAALQLALLQNAERPATPALPRCSLRQQRLQRFLHRQHAGDAVVACPLSFPLTASKE